MASISTVIRRRKYIRKIQVLCAIVKGLLDVVQLWLYFTSLYLTIKSRRLKTNIEKSNERLVYLFRLIKENDRACISELRMDRRTFYKLCEMIREVGGLKETKNMMLEEIVAMFVNILAHHKKNRTIATNFLRSGETISRHFNQCLLAMLKLHSLLLKKPEPITDACGDDRWKCFKNCLGALDGTYIRVNPPATDQPRYRTRKASLATNVLGVCSMDMQFIYILPGWEGSAHDGRVLRNAISRPNGLKVPQGCYYLVDAGYCNADGFLAPYRGQRYHLREYNGRSPESAEEYFNMKHSRARNVIERCFGLLKGRWKILASPSFFPIKIQIRIIMACALLHNLIRREMSTDVLEDEYQHEESSDCEEDEEDTEVEYISNISSNDQWSNFRNNLAQEMFNSWRSRRIQ